jgi:hypothetical protein
LCGIVRSLLSAERGSARPGIEAQAGVERAARSEAGRSAETMALERAEREDVATQDGQGIATRRVAALRARLAGQELEPSVCDLLAEEGAEKMKAVQMAARLGRPVGEVYEALSRVRRYMGTIVAIERDEERDEGLRSVEDQP